MNYTPKILAFAGALRRDSTNKKTVRVAVEGARKAGAEVNYIDFRDFPVPLYDGDIESSEGLPENAIRLQELMLEHDGFLISSPEYNSSIPGTFKNYIDWTSRARGELKAGACYDGKAVSLMMASPGSLGGIRALPTVRSILGTMGVYVLPEDFCVSRSDKAFDENGAPVDVFIRERLERLGENLVDFLRKIKA